jgi:SPP1 family predicted phage head-tail adaptor
MAKRMSAGDLRDKITVQRSTEVPNDLNEPVLTWVELVTVRAKRDDASSGEKEAAGQVGAFLMSRFTIRRSSEADSIRATDRIVHEGANWAIIEIMRLQDAPTRFLVIKAVRDAD